jgi:hypothetical protein
MFQIQVAVANMPITLVCLSNGTLAFVRISDCKALFDMSPTPAGVSAAFYEDGFVIDDVEYQYSTAYEYKTIPSMLLWLQQQNLQNPLQQG